MQRSGLDYKVNGHGHKVCVGIVETINWRPIELLRTKGEMPKAQSNINTILEEIKPWLQGFLQTPRVFHAFKSQEGEKVSEQT